MPIRSLSNDTMLLKECAQKESSNNTTYMYNNVQSCTASKQVDISYNTNFKENRKDPNFQTSKHNREPGNVQRNAEMGNKGEEDHNMPNGMITHDSSEKIVNAITSVVQTVSKSNKERLGKVKHKATKAKENGEKESKTLKDMQISKPPSQPFSILTCIFNEAGLSTDDKWSSHEDINKAYLELNLNPPSSPNDTSSIVIDNR